MDEIFLLQESCCSVELRVLQRHLFPVYSVFSRTAIVTKLLLSFDNLTAIYLDKSKHLTIGICSRVYSLKAWFC